MAKPIDYSILQNIPPEKAIKYFESLGYAITWDWRESIPAIEAQAFTVAKAMKMDILQDIKSEVTKALETGETFQTFKKNLQPILEKKGWWGKQIIDGETVQLGSPARLENIYRTNLSSAYNAGRFKSFEENKAERPWIELSELQDNAARDNHKKMNQTRAPIDHEIWKSPKSRIPPNGYRCRGTIRALTNKQAKERGGLYIPNPSVGPDEGFGNNPAKNPYQPKKSDYDKDIWEAAND